MAFQSLVLGQPVFLFVSRALCTGHESKPRRMPMKASTKTNGYPFPSMSKCVQPCTFGGSLFSGYGNDFKLFGKAGLRCFGSTSSGRLNGNNAFSKENLNFIRELLKKGIIVAAIVCGVLVFGCKRAFAMEGVVTVMEQSKLLIKNAWPRVLPVIRILKEQGLVLGILLALSAFFSMAETSITTLWPWKVRELAKKGSENGVFKLLRNDITRFLTTIPIGTTVVNIAATALVTDAATAVFGEAGISAVTGVMTVAILLLTEITPKSIAVHNATEVARFVVRPVAWLSLVLYPVGRVFTYLSMGMLTLLGIKGRSEPYVTEEELKLMLRGAELSGAIEEEEQDMIQNVLEIKETQVREVMTPLVDVVAIDASASLVDFQTLWIGHPYSRVPVFEKRIDNIIGIAYAKDMLVFRQKGELLDTTPVQELAHMPVYFVPDSMSIWDLLRDFRFKKVHMAVVCNEYGGTVGIVTLEDIVEEIVGEIFDENDSKEEIQKKTGCIVMQEKGVFDVDANTSIDQLSEDLNVKMPEGHQYETVSGFVCEKFGYIPKIGQCIEVVLERKNEDNDASNTDHQDQKETFELEILAGNARKVTAVRFTRKNGFHEMETKEVAILLLTEITPKSIAVHNATEVARFLVRPVAWLSLVLYPVGRVFTYLSMGMLKLLGIKGRSEPYVTEEELKLMIKGAKLSGAIEEEEQDMIRIVLEIKETQVREVMTPLVDVVAIDASASLVDFPDLVDWTSVLKKRIDNIIGIAYAKDMLDFLQKGELLDTTPVQEFTCMPVYFVPDSMSTWDFLRDFRFKKVHMAVVCNEYGGIVGIVTLEDIVEEIVGEIFDENDSKEEIQKKTGCIVLQKEGVFDVDANTSIDQLFEDLKLKMPEGHQYETVSGFVCENFGHIPKIGECIEVVLERKNEDNDASNTDHQDQNETFELVILAGNARKVTTVRFTRMNVCHEMLKTKEVIRKAPKLIKRKGKLHRPPLSSAQMSLAPLLFVK